MVDRTVLALHDRIDSEHFDLHLLKEAVRSLQQRVIILESEIRALRREALDDEATQEVLRDTEAAMRKVPPRGS